MEEKETASRLYELGFILVPNTPENEVQSKVDALKTVITSTQGIIVSEGYPEYIDLAYTMEKTVGSKKSHYSQGYFGWIKFNTTPEAMAVLKKAFDADADIVRYMLIKTSEQNTIVFKKPKVEAKRDVEVNEEDPNAVLEDDSVEEENEVLAAHEVLPNVADDMEVEADSTQESKEV